MRNLVMALLAAVLLVVAGCGGTENSSLSGSATGSGSPALASLRVNLEYDTGTARLRLSDQTALVRIEVYSSTGQLLRVEQRSRVPGQSSDSFVIEGLPAGPVLVRAIAFDAQGAIIGYQDQSVALGSGPNQVTIDTLTPGAPPPVPGASPSPSVAASPSPSPLASPSPSSSPTPSGSPTASPSASPTPSASPVQATSLSIDPASLTIQVFQNRQLKANALQVGGSQVDVTDQVVWESSVPSVAAVSSTGFLTALHAGESMVTARLGALSSQIPVLVTDQAAAPSPTPPIVGPPAGITFVNPANSVDTYPAAGQIGTDFSPVVQVFIIDSQGLLVPTASGTVTLTTSVGNLTLAGGAPASSVTVPIANGIATFTNLQPSGALGLRSLTATTNLDAFTAPAATTTFTVSAGPGATLVWQTGNDQPTGIDPFNGRDQFGTALILRILDSEGNLSTGDSTTQVTLVPDSVRFSFASGNVRTAVNGVVTFPGFSVTVTVLVPNGSPTTMETIHGQATGLTDSPASQTFPLIPLP